MLIPDRYYDAVVPVAYEMPSPETGWQTDATGFLFSAQRKTAGGKDFQHLFFVTNKHVVERQFSQPDGSVLKAPREIIYLGFDPEERHEKAGFFGLELLDKDRNRLWTSRDEIDVAVLQITGGPLAETKRRYHYFDSDNYSMSIEEMESDRCFEGESVFVIGFPAGPREEFRHYPVVRRGTIARIRDTYARALPSFIVEVMATPGNSGGPVILLPTPFHLDAELGKEEKQRAPSKTKLIGIVSDYLEFFGNIMTGEKVVDEIYALEHSGLSTVWTVDAIELLVNDHFDRFPHLIPRQD